MELLTYEACKTIIINFSTIITTFYILFKVTKIPCKAFNIIFTTVSTITTIFVSLFTEQVLKIDPVISLVALICTSSIFLMKKSPIHIPIFASIISMGISYCLRVVALFPSSILAYYVNLDSDNLFFGFVILAIQLILAAIFVKIKRFRNGFTFLSDIKNAGVGLILSGVIFILMYTISPYDTPNKSIGTIFIIGMLISLVGFFLWIRKSLSNKYRDNLRIKEVAKFEDDIAQRDETIKKLTDSNAYLSKIVHRDNHLIGSLQYSIKDVLENQQDLSEIKSILSDMLTMFEQRSELVLKEQAELKILPTTGVSLIDGALANMLVKANAHNISFDVSVQNDIHYLVNNVISLTQLETLLCDHIKDAVIAVESSNTQNGRILVNFTNKEHIYEISVSDNAHDFDVEVLAKLGVERITTHKTTGGSGIGFMTTFETLKQTGCSLIINEFENKIPFSKSIVFRFDGQNDFIINTYRSDLLSQALNRADLKIFNNGKL